jgi:hypothetical protein
VKVLKLAHLIGQVMKIFEEMGYPKLARCAGCFVDDRYPTGSEKTKMRKFSVSYH